jgi:hypothetical protein
MHPLQSIADEGDRFCPFLRVITQQFQVSLNNGDDVRSL